MNRIKVTVEKAGHNYSAFIPSIDGIIGVGKAPADAIKSLCESIEILREEHDLTGDDFPEELLGDYELVVDEVKN